MTLFPVGWVMGRATAAAIQRGYPLGPSLTRINPGKPVNQKPKVVASNVHQSIQGDTAGQYEHDNNGYH